jgi:uncharacterized protein (DUF2342 family)
MVGYLTKVVKPKYPPRPRLTLAWAPRSTGPRREGRGPGRRSEPFADSYHYASLRTDFEELTALAEEQVAESHRPAQHCRCCPRPRHRPPGLGARQHRVVPAAAAAHHHRLEENMAANPFAPVASRVAGAEMGMVLGWMSSRVLGQYDLLVIEDEDPDRAGHRVLRGPQHPRAREALRLPAREFRHWLALHEVTHRAQFTGIPWMREHFLGLVQQTVDAVDPTRSGSSTPSAGWPTSCATGRNPLDDGGVMALLASPEQRKVLDQVAGLMSLLEGHGDVTMDRAGADQIPSAERFGTVLRSVASRPTRRRSCSRSSSGSRPR